MGVYEPLSRHLRSLKSDSWNANFSDIERILSRKLPESAYRYSPWWGNQKSGNHSQAKAWREAGWETRDVDTERQVVRFERVLTPAEGGAGKLEDLIARARELSGIADREGLLIAALESFIRKEAAKYLASLGGTMPDFEVPARERPSA